MCHKIYFFIKDVVYFYYLGCKLQNIAMDLKKTKKFFKLSLNFLCPKVYKQQVRCNQKGLQRLHVFALSETQLCSAESINVCSQIFKESESYLDSLVVPQKMFVL